MDKSYFFSFLTCNEHMKIYASLYKLQNPDKKIHKFFTLLNLNSCKERYVKNLNSSEHLRLKIAISLLSPMKVLVLDLSP